jgi:hypothetical protein
MAFGRVTDLALCGTAGGAGAILSFELARTPAELAALLTGQRCIDAQAAALWIDELWFIPAYTAFLALGAWSLRQGGRGLALAALSAFLLAGLFDEIEGLVMFALLGDSLNGPGIFSALFWAVHLKFALLGIGEVLLAALMFRYYWPRVAAVPIGTFGLVSLWFLLTDPHDRWLMLAHRNAWMALLAFAIVAAIRPALAARRGAV